MSESKKVLIIKTGYSETLCPELSKTCSLGDVVRSTFLLNYYKKDKVTWVTDEKAVPLLMDNPLIDKVLAWNFETALILKEEAFDTIINLEKSPAICACLNKTYGAHYFGFGFASWSGTAKACYHSGRALVLSHNKKKKPLIYWQKHLASMIGKRWKESEGYCMPRPKVSKQYDVGFNLNVGSKWPDKAWPAINWHLLDELLESNKITICYQKDLNDIKKYMEWIASCRVVVTCDSLGMHLAIGYGIPTIALFGPSPSGEVFLYGSKIVASSGDMRDIKVEEVAEKVCGLLGQEKNL